MGASLDRLISAGSPSLSADLLNAEERMNRLGNASMLAPLFDKKNGFYAFESALLVRPITPTPGVADVLSWNGDGEWWEVYGDLIADATFFAEDLFGCQFGVQRGFVISFNPESGEMERFAENLEEWARKLIDDYETATGYPLAHEWQLRHRPLGLGERLIPAVPFMLGGEFVTDNLRPMAEVPAMNLYKGIYMATSQIPDGTQVVIELDAIDKHRT